MLNLGILHDRQGEASEAFRWFTKAAENGDLESMTSFGVFHFKQGELADALEWQGEPRGWCQG